MSKPISFTKYDAQGNVVCRHVFTTPGAIAVINAQYCGGK